VQSRNKYGARLGHDHDDHICTKVAAALHCLQAMLHTEFWTPHLFTVPIRTPHSKARPISPARSAQKRQKQVHSSRPEADWRNLNHFRFRQLAPGVLNNVLNSSQFCASSVLCTDRLVDGQWNDGRYIGIHWDRCHGPYIAENASDPKASRAAAKSNAIFFGSWQQSFESPEFAFHVRTDLTKAFMAVTKGRHCLSYL